MQRPEVIRLYKYFDPSDRSLSALRDGAYWFSAPPSFNDPFDCGITLAEDGFDESLANAISRIRANPEKYGTIPEGPAEVRPQDIKAYNVYRQQLSSLAASIGVLCLSECRDNLLMWAHYAKSHQGFCVGFVRAPDNILGSVASPVNYHTTLPRLTAEHFDSALSPHSFDNLWLTKSADWAYEKEWRLAAERGGVLRTLNAPVAEVIIGMRMASETRETLLAVVKQMPGPIVVYQAQRDKTRFALALEVVSL